VSLGQKGPNPLESLGHVLDTKGPMDICFVSMGPGVGRAVWWAIVPRRAGRSMTAGDGRAVAALGCRAVGLGWSWMGLGGRLVGDVGEIGGR